MDPVRVVIADDHPVLRLGLQQLLARAQGIVLVGEAGDGLEALRLARDLAPNVLLLDVEMPEMDGVEVAARVQAERLPVRVLALSAYSDRRYVQGIPAAGAAGYLLKDEAPERIVQAILAVARGEDGWISPRVIAKMRVLVDEGSSLSERQVEILGYLAKNLSNREIAHALGIGEKAVEKQLQALYERLGVEGRVGAAAWAAKHGLV